jgi:hypothetical protein
MCRMLELHLELVDQVEREPAPGTANRARKRAAFSR